MNINYDKNTLSQFNANFSQNKKNHSVVQYQAIAQMPLDTPKAPADPIARLQQNLTSF